MLREIIKRIELMQSQKEECAKIPQEQCERLMNLYKKGLFQLTLLKVVLQGVVIIVHLSCIYLILITVYH